MSEQTKGENRPIPSKNLSQVPQDAVSFVEIGPDAEGQRLDNFLMKLGITAAGTVIDLHDIPF